MKGSKPLTIVLKLGTSSIVDEVTREPLLSILCQIVEVAVKLRRGGHRVIIVSSGAIGVGLLKMNMKERPKGPLAKLQALAAIGQCRLMGIWTELFEHFSQPIAQILLTRNDIQDRTMYRNAQRTVNELLNMGVIPIVNENDTLAVAEIKFGDNDTLSAITAAMIRADYLFLLTDVDCLYDKNPRQYVDAKPVMVVSDISALNVDVSTGGSALGTGGMSTKIVAARLATSAGVTTIIMKSSKPEQVCHVLQYCQAQKTPLSSSSKPGLSDNVFKASSQPPTPGVCLSSSSSSASLSSHVPVLPLSSKFHYHENQDFHDHGCHRGILSPPSPPLHTRFLPASRPIHDRHFWLLHGLAPHGTIYIDRGAYLALLGKAGLLPAGVVDVEGSFHHYEAVRLAVVDRKPFSTTTTTIESTDYTNDERGGLEGTGRAENGHAAGEKMWEGEAVEVGRCLVNYAAPEVARIKGHRSSDIKPLLGYADSEYIAHRNHVCFFSDHSHEGLLTWGSGSLDEVKAKESLVDN